jgi:hypothetical protein
LESTSTPKLSAQSSYEPSTSSKKNNMISKSTRILYQHTRLFLTVLIILNSPGETNFSCFIIWLHKVSIRNRRWRGCRNLISKDGNKWLVKWTCSIWYKRCRNWKRQRVLLWAMIKIFWIQSSNFIFKMRQFIVIKNIKRNSKIVKTIF